MQSYVCLKSVLSNTIVDKSFFTFIGRQNQTSIVVLMGNTFCLFVQLFIRIDRCCNVLLHDLNYPTTELHIME